MQFFRTIKEKFKEVFGKGEKEKNEKRKASSLSREVIELAYSRLKQKGKILEIQLFLLAISGLSRDREGKFDVYSLTFSQLKDIPFSGEEKEKLKSLISVYGEKRIIKALEEITVELIRARAETI